MRRKATAAVALVAAGAPCAVTAPPASAAPVAQQVQITRFLGERRLPHLMSFRHTTVGGLSGIDRDPVTGTWYFVSDDRGRYNPARFYRGRLDFNPADGAFTGVRLTGVTTLRRPDGQPYAPFGEPQSADPETIRFDPWTRHLLWGSEGDRPDTAHPRIPLSQPFVRWSGRDGRHLDDLRLPRNLLLTTTDHGPRRNASIEGMAFAPRRIAVMLEGPRHEDGPAPTVERGATARITLWNRWPRRVLAQYVYQIDRLPAPPSPLNGAYDSGVSEILAVDDHRYLALERSWIQGVGYKVRLYEFDVRGATNVLAIDGLADGLGYRPVAKRLVHEFGPSQSPVQNLEGLSWGPRLRTGECTLVVGSDDNFDPQEVTQFLAFGVRGARGCP